MASIGSDWSAFERPLPNLVHACASRFSGVFVDVGANTGYYALLAAASSAKIRVFAFEPDASVLPLLRENVVANGLRGRITISDFALSDRTGSSQLYVPTQEHGLVDTSSSLEKSFKGQHSEVRGVSVTTLDRFLGRVFARLLRGSRLISILKIDVEGHEAAVLRGSSTTVARFRPLIFVEVLSVADFRFLSDFIAAHNYVDIPLGLEAVTTFKKVEFFHSAWNHALVPNEKLELFLEIAKPVFS